MNKLFKRTINIISLAVCILAMNIVVLAQGTTTISVSKSSPAVGDSVTVSITATESGTITVKYTSSMLSVSSCNVSGYTAEGNTVSFSGKTGDIVFTAASSGTASIIVSSSSCSGSSTTLSIGSGASSTTTSTTTESPEATVEVTTDDEPAEANAEVETTEPTETTQTASTGSTGTLNADGGFDINGVSYVVSERFSDSEMPSGFSKTTVTIGSSTYSEPTNGSITLLYLKPADNTSGSGVFYLYNAEAGTVSDFVMLGNADKYVLVQEAGEPLDSGFSQAVITVNGSEINAYTMDGSEFFYVYGVNQDQVEGWYVYDQTYETVSRVDTSVIGATSTSSDDSATDVSSTDSNSLYIEKLSLYRKIIMGLIILCVFLLFIIINRAIKNRGDDDDDFDGDVFAKTPVKTSKRLPRSIVFHNKVEDEYDEDDVDDEEFDDEDDYDDDDDFSTSEDTYEERRNASLNMMDLNDL